jgi:amidase
VKTILRVLPGARLIRPECCSPMKRFADPVRQYGEGNRRGGDGASTGNALIRDVNFPSPDDVARVSILLCSLEAAAAHEATFPSRASEYGPVLAGLLESARAFDALAMAEIVFCREAFRVQLNALFRDIDLVIMPATNAAAPTVADMAPDRRTSEAVQARIRLTAPFNMSGHPTLTLPGGKTDDGLPVGFQIVGRHMAEALILRTGYAFQQMTYWH